jgi:DNA-binding transcriptional LysR family regulator
MKLNLQDFSVIVSLSSHRSIRTTARHLNLTPANVSKIVQSIERKLNITLVKRGPLGIVMTPEGEGLFQVAKNILEQWDGYQSNRNPSQRSVCTIGAMSFINTFLLSRIVKDWSELTGTDLRFIDTSPDQLFQIATRGGFDFVVYVGEQNWSGNWVQDKLGTLKWSLFCRSENPLPNHTNERRVLEFQFVVPTYWEENRFSIGADLCPASWIVRKKGAEASTANSAAQIVAASDQLAFLPYPVGISSGLREVLVDDWPSVERNVYLASQMDSVKQSWRKLLRDQLKRKWLGNPG